MTQASSSSLAQCAGASLAGVMEYDRVLDQHCHQCRSARSRMLPAFMFLERVHGLVAPRFVTTVVGASVVMALLSWGF